MEEQKVIKSKRHSAEYVQKMRELQGTCDTDDTEGTHQEADALLCELLKRLGYTDVVEEYEKVGKWYA